MKDMFEKAVRAKLRFKFKGFVSVEDLWDLSIEELDSIFKILNSRLQETQQESLLSVKNSKNEVLELKIEVIKHIFSVKRQENIAKEEAVLNAGKKKKLLDIIADKQDTELKEKSVKELKKMVKKI